MCVFMTVSYLLAHHSINIEITVGALISSNQARLTHWPLSLASIYPDEEVYYALTCETKVSFNVHEIIDS